MGEFYVEIKWSLDDETLERLIKGLKELLPENFEERETLKVRIKFNKLGGEVKVDVSSKKKEQ